MSNPPVLLFHRRVAGILGVAVAEPEGLVGVGEYVVRRDRDLGSG